MRRLQGLLRINTSLPKQIQLSYFQCNKYFGLPISVSCLVKKNANDEESVPSVSVSKGCTSRLFVRNNVHMNQKRREELLS